MRCKTSFCARITVKTAHGEGSMTWHARNACDGVALGLLKSSWAKHARDLTRNFCVLASVTSVAPFAPSATLSLASGAIFTPGSTLVVGVCSLITRFAFAGLFLIFSIPSDNARRAWRCPRSIIRPRTSGTGFALTNVASYVHDTIRPCRTV